MVSKGQLPQVILIHGTGASDSAIRGEKWWQLDSPFERELSARIAGKAEIADPFRWSGENSERDRRAAAKALLARLRALDSSGVQYHLVGHSHGGSVIWHALHQSVRSASLLRGLKSWTTVGTPFLNFQPTPPVIWNYLLLAILSLIVGWAFFWRASPSEWWPVARGYSLAGQNWQPALLLGASVGFLLLLWVIAAYRVVVPLLNAAKHLAWDSFADLRARNAYGALWLGLWHPLDEPINGLAATLGKPPQITPRISADNLWSLLPVIGWLIRLVNWVPARAADEFAWLQISRRLQGADISNLSLASVSRAPKALEPGFGPVPQEIAAEMRASADEKAAEVVGRLRAILEAAYDVQDSEVVFKRIGGALTFQEIVHTSYFDFPYIAAAAASHIMVPPAAPVSLSAASQAAEFPAVISGLPGLTAAEHATLLPSRLASSIRQTAQPSAYLNYSFMRTIVFFGLATLFSTFAALSVYDSVVTPQTDRYVVDRIARALDDPAKTNVGRRASTAQVVVRLAKLRVIPDPEAKLNGLTDKRALACSHHVLAEYFGSTGEFDRARASLANIAEAERPEVNDGGAQCDDDMPPLRQTRLLAVLAAPHKNAMPEPRKEVLNALLDQVAKDLASEWDIETPDRAEKLAYVMAEHKRDDLLKLIIEGEFSELDPELRPALCSFIRLADRQSQQGTQVAAASKSRDACTRASTLEPQPKGLSEEEIAKLQSEPLLTRLRVVLQNNLEPSVLEVTPVALLLQLDTLLPKAFSLIPMRNSDTAQRSAAFHEQSRAWLDLSRILIFAASRMNTPQQEEVKAKIEQQREKVSAARYEEVLTEVGISIARYNKEIFRSPVIGNFMISVLEARVELLVDQSISWVLRSDSFMRRLEDTLLLASSVTSPEKLLNVIDKKSQKYLDETDLDESIAKLVLLARAAERFSKDQPDRGRDRASKLTMKMISKIKFDEQSWQNVDGKYTGSAIKVAKFARSLPLGSRSQLIDDAERGLQYVTDPKERSDYISELVKLRAEARDLDRARVLAERAFDADTVMRGYAAILDQLIDKRMQGHSGSTGGGW